MFSPLFKIAIMQEVFKDDSWESMHDSVYEATDKSYEENELKSMFMELPETIQCNALKWGLCDTEVGDDIYLHFKGNNDE